MKRILIASIAIIICLLLLSIILFGYNEPFFDKNAPNYNDFTKNEKNDPLNFPEYHSNENLALNKTGFNDLSGGMWVKDSTGKATYYESNTFGTQGNINYYEPGTYRFGASSYVPSYEDSVLLSSLKDKTVIDSVNSSPFDSPAASMGSCVYYKDNPDKLEEICNSTKTSDCASMSCCVLLGGSSCVSGNITGPTLKSSYGDIFLKNRDFYYYQGKCYGNCPVVNATAIVTTSPVGNVTISPV